MSRLDEHAQALGYLTIRWSQLEMALDRLLGTLMFAEEGKPLTAPQAKAAHCVTANARDLRNKTRMILSLGHLRQPYDDWFSNLESCLNSIDNLRETRNRLVHAGWLVGVKPGSDDIDVIRRKIGGTRIAKTQSYTRELIMNESTNVSVNEISQFNDTINESQVMLMLLLGNFLHPRFFPWP